MPQRNPSLSLIGLCMFTAFGAAKAQTVTDIDGNVYNTVTINGQVWMQENLATSRYQDGTPIPLVSNATTWFNIIASGGRCFYDNDSAANAPDYGTLYNWNVVTNPLNVCPMGWHVPTDAEWNAMTVFLDPTVDPNWSGTTGTGTDIADQLKEVGTAHWDLAGGTNSSGFTARGAGYRTSIGDYDYLLSFTHFWTSTYGQQGMAWIRSLNFNDPTIVRMRVDRLYGASIRCVQDISTSVPDNGLDEGLQLFPNPATDVVQLGGLPHGPVDLVITDAAGRQVRSERLSANTRRVSVAGLVPGVYLLSATTATGEQRAWLRVE
ncbi:MAG: FISUMP domain-containing protein [Flavobacteriales bacterium]